MISDAAYKRETEDGYSLRGALYLRAAGNDRDILSGEETVVHVIDVACKSQKRVTRSTFAAELLAAGEAADQGLLTAHMLYETERGVLSAREARERRSKGGYIPISLSIHAKSVLAAVTATFIKRLADQSLLCDVQYFRELLDLQVISELGWIDTRDMYADR